MLPYYKIPNRNLFTGKMNREQWKCMVAEVVSILQFLAPIQQANFVLNKLINH